MAQNNTIFSEFLTRFNGIGAVCLVIFLFCELFRFSVSFLVNYHQQLIISLPV